MECEVVVIGWPAILCHHACDNLGLTSFLNFSYCDLTHTKTSLNKEKVVRKILPYLFQDDLLCAGTLVGNPDLCKGDSGGPIITQNLFNQKWTQIGVVHGSIGECCNNDYPGIYIRLNHPLVLDFIISAMKTD